MSLPKLNNAPKYTITIPSTQKQVRFRPFLVKEEKVLMLAAESKDQTQMYNAVVDTIIACVEEPIERQSLTTFDIEYLFVKIRAKSVGETAEFGIKCSKCGESNKVSINVDDINIKVPIIKDTIDLTDNIKLKMRWPKYLDIIKMQLEGSKLSAADQTFHTIAYCIDSILTEDDVIKVSDQPMSEMVDFIDQLNNTQFEMLKNYIQQIPQLSHTLNFK